MIPHKLNGRLLFLALLGIVLYFTANAITQLSGNKGLEDDWGRPAVSMNEAKTTAEKFLKERVGFEPEKLLVSYQNEPYMSGYLIKNNLMKSYGKTFEDDAPLDYWLVVAQTKGTGKTRYEIRVSMDKPKVTAWSKEPSGSTSAASGEAGTVLAMKALKDEGFDPDAWTYDAGRSGDGSYIFTNKTLRVGEANMQVNIHIADGEVLSVQPGFDVPDSYMNYIKPQKRMAGWMTGGSLFLTIALGITALVYLIVYARDISFVRGIFLSVALFVLYILANLNVTPGLMAASNDADTEAFMHIFVTGFVIIAALLTAASVWISLLAGDQQWRMKGWNPWPRWRDADFGEEVFYGMGRGYLITFFILGVQQILFLIAGNVFDSFAVSDPTQSVYNMQWPFLFPALAWVAAIMEEVVYRLFGIILFKKLLRFNFLAVLVPSIIWALGHTSYALYPSYTRLFEVTLLGFIFGYTFLKYGLITAIFTHASMDSLLMGLSLMIEEPTSINIASGLFFILLPALIGYIIRFLHPRFRPKRREPFVLQAEPPLLEP